MCGACVNARAGVRVNVCVHRACVVSYVGGGGQVHVDVCFVFSLITVLTEFVV